MLQRVAEVSEEVDGQPLKRYNVAGAAEHQEFPFQQSPILL
jgi:hypothetical protein